MDLISSRARAYVAIDAFERDLRDLITKYVLDHLKPEVGFKHEFNELRRRQASDVEDAEDTELVDYLYTRQAYDILLRHIAVVPKDLGELLRLHVGAMDSFVSVRNRVMHGRPLRFEDLDQVRVFLTRFISRYFSQASLVAGKLSADPDWQPPFTARAAANERVLHNLPIADFDETGLIGRGVEVKALTDLLIRGRDRMITLTGEGGIGKTALALDACYVLVDQVDPPFEAVLWVSLKSERLTVSGVQAIANAVRDVSGATEELGRALDATFAGSLTQLADYLAGVRALVVIDNLETAQGREVVALYDALPESVTFLFTSRVGIGEIERRIPISGLSPGDAVLLLRRFATRRGLQDLASLPPVDAEKRAVQLRYSPLAIRWFVLSVESGRTPSDVLRNQEELLKFCVENVLAGLSDHARRTVAVLRTLDRPLAFDELAIVSEIEIDDLRRAAQSLSQGSLLVRTPAAAAGLPDLLELSATARAFLPGQHLGDEFLNEVLRREAAYVRDREDARHDAGRRLLGANVVFVRSAEDEPVAHLLRLALQWSRRGDLDEAQSHLVRARQLNPTYFEVDRVSAFIASGQGNAAVATARYRDALANCGSEEEKARVSYFLAGHLARKAHDLAAAIPLAEFAHSCLEVDDTAAELGTLYIWDKRYERGQQLLETILDDDQLPKLRRIVITQLVSSWQRWADDDLRERMPISALERALSGIHTGYGLLDEGVYDGRLAAAICDCLLVAIRAAAAIGQAPEALGSRLVAVLERASRDPRLEVARNYGRLRQALRVLPDGVDSSFVEEPETAYLNEAGRLVGTVISMHAGFGFIRHAEYPKNVFFHVDDLATGQRFESLKPGSKVAFAVSRDESDRDRASGVEHVE